MANRVTESYVARDIHIIHKNQSELDTVNGALSKIYNDGNGAGASLLSAIYRNCRGNQGVYIRLTSGSSETFPELTNEQRYRLSEERGINISSDYSDPIHNEAAWRLSFKNDDGHHGEGVDAFIKWRADQYIHIDSRGRPSGATNSNLAFTSLAHELVHAYRMVKGSVIDSRRTEERRAIGLGQFSDSRFSENAIRDEHNLRLRARYISYNLSSDEDSPESGSDYY